MIYGPLGITSPQHSWKVNQFQAEKSWSSLNLASIFRNVSDFSLAVLIPHWCVCIIDAVEVEWRWSSSLNAQEMKFLSSCLALNPQNLKFWPLNLKGGQSSIHKIKGNPWTHKKAAWIYKQKDKNLKKKTENFRNNEWFLWGYNMGPSNRPTFC